MTQYNAAYQLFRGISFTVTNTPDYINGTAFAEIMQSQIGENSSALTESLNDFSAFCQIHGNDSYTTVKLDDLSWRDRWNKDKKNTIFATQEGKEYLEEHGSIGQDQIFRQNISYDGGLRYANEGDRYTLAAINFASADINAVETAHYELLGSGHGNGSLNAEEAASGHRNNYTEKYKELIGALNLDCNTSSITAEEYAAYLILADCIRYDEETNTYNFNTKDLDGLITPEEAEWLSRLDGESLRESALKIFDSYFG